ncbi:hypothetical protein [Achromobacter xylosoxidans]|uniref:hypothetical protein n=1 Tax=Alcaligenes xylosoxydans xylosoxydans TaxID=85698 RepID=UPI001F1367E1|nr:hypothetical protein [Achromobacter xylosoxidans]
MDIKTLIEQLAAASKALPSVDSNYCATHSIHYVPEKPNFYVEPALDAPRELSPILLISAPAAVGKTTLAHHIHTELVAKGQGALYIPLQEASIGHDFFAGRLAGVFPNLTKRQILESVFRGEIVLLFDGYDEVTMRSDQIDRNKEFIAEIKSELDEFERAHGQAKPCIVFLFRSVFADFGVFDGIKQIAADINVRFFDAERRKQFLKQYLDSKAGDKAKTKGHLSREFLDGFETSLESAKDDSSAFFGHAIVLSAFGDYLHEQDESNAARLASNLSESETVETVAVELLTRIIERILTREESKFPLQEYAAHMPTYAPYSSAAQQELLLAVAEDEFLRNRGEESNHTVTAITRLVDRFKAHPEYSALNVEIREALSLSYRNELEKRISHHPFIDVPKAARANSPVLLDKIEFRNPVYREYYFSQVIISKPSGAWELDATRNYYSHYLALFFLGLVEGRDITPYQPFLFSLISLFATSSSGNDFQFQLVWNVDSLRWEGTIDTLHLQVRPFFISDSLLTIKIPLHGILQDGVFSGSGDCMIDIAGPGPGSSFAGKITLTTCRFIAPTIYISAASVKFVECYFSSESLHFVETVESLEGLDTLTIRAYQGKPTELELANYVKSRWGEAIEAATKTGGITGMTLFQQKLQKILLRFRKHQRAEYGCHDKKFHTQILADNNDVAVASLSKFLFDRDFLANGVPGLITMDQDKFSAYDIHYQKQNAISFGLKSKDLYQEFLQTPEGYIFR